MPPHLDIYGLTGYRDAVTIDRFLRASVDRAASEDRGDEALLIERLPFAQPGADVDAYEWEPAVSLSHIIARGLAIPRRAFTAYLTPQRADLTSAILSFTADDQLILGISLDDEGARPENERRAREILAQLVEAYACHCGLILVERQPPRSEAACYAQAKEPHTVFFSTFPERPRSG